jgi:hypothetical protein
MPAVTNGPVSIAKGKFSDYVKGLDYTYEIPQSLAAS